MPFFWDPTFYTNQITVIFWFHNFMRQFRARNCKSYATFIHHKRNIKKLPDLADRKLFTKLI